MAKQKTGVPKSFEPQAFLPEPGSSKIPTEFLSVNLTFRGELIVALASNPQVYQGKAADAASVVKMADQIIAEMVDAER